MHDWGIFNNKLASASVLDTVHAKIEPDLFIIIMTRYAVASIIYDKVELP